MAEVRISESQFRRALFPGVALPLLIMAVVAAISFGLVRDLLQANAWLEHSRLVISRARHTQALLGQMETAVRGYLLTGQEDLLRPYTAARPQVAPELADLRRLLADNPDQSRRLAEIQRTYDHWDGELARLIRAKRDGLPPATLDIDIERRDMYVLSPDLQSVLADEERLLATGSVRASRAAEVTWVVGLSVLLGAALLIAGIAYSHIRQMARRYVQALESERQQTQAQRDSEARLAGIISSAMDAILSINEDQRIVLFNAAAERMFGLPREQALGESLDRFIPPAYRQLHRQQVEAFGQTGTTSRAMGALGKLTALRANGEEFPIEAAISQINVGGQRLYTVILRDITERKKAEDATKRANQALEALVRASPLPVIALDLRGKVTLWNRAAEELFGWSQAEVLGQDMPHVPANEQASADEVFNRTVAGESLTGLEIRRCTRDGHILDISLATAPLREPSGQITGMIGVSTDITERKRYEEELHRAKEEAEAASKAKDQFLAVLSHELRTPLTPVLSMVTAMETLDWLPTEVHDELGMIRRNVELEARLIDDMLDLTRIARGKLQLHLEPLDLHTALRHALEISQAEIRQKGLHVSVSLAATRTWVRADPARLQQVLWNLIKNAAKFTPTDGTITIRTWNEKTVQSPVASSQNGPGHLPQTAERLQLDPGHRTLDTLVIEVNDTGIGIAPDVLPRIFNAFEQGEQTITRQFGGLGLGLAISRALVESHGGQITAASDGKDKGATFTVRLPTVEAPARRHERAFPRAKPSGDGQAPAPARQDLHLLLVEDHVDTARVMAKLLGILGYQVTTAHNLAEALAAAAHTRFDLVISDIGLPDGTGLELMAQLRRRPGGGSLPGIALTGFGMDADVQKSRAAGFAEHLTKPVDFQTLDQTIQRVISESDSEVQSEKLEPQSQ